MMSWAKTVAAKMERMEKLRSSSESQDLLMVGRGGKRTVPGLLPGTAYVLFKEWETRLGHRAGSMRCAAVTLGTLSSWAVACPQLVPRLSPLWLWFIGTTGLQSVLLVG